MTYNNVEDLGLTLFAQSLAQNTTLMSFKLFGNHFGQESLRLFCSLFENEERESDFYPDFVVYFVDDHFEMAFHKTNIEDETNLGMDIFVNK